MISNWLGYTILVNNDPNYRNSAFNASWNIDGYSYHFPWLAYRVVNGVAEPTRDTNLLTLNTFGEFELGGTLYEYGGQSTVPPYYTITFYSYDSGFDTPLGDAWLHLHVERADGVVSIMARGSIGIDGPMQPDSLLVEELGSESTIGNVSSAIGSTFHAYAYESFNGLSKQVIGLTLDRFSLERLYDPVVYATLGASDSWVISTWSSGRNLLTVESTSGGSEAYRIFTAQISDGAPRSIDTTFTVDGEIVNINHASILFSTAVGVDNIVVLKLDTDTGPKLQFDFIDIDDLDTDPEERIASGVIELDDIDAGFSWRYFDANSILVVYAKAGTLWAQRMDFTGALLDAPFAVATGDITPGRISHIGDGRFAIFYGTENPTDDGRTLEVAILDMSTAGVVENWGNTNDVVGGTVFADTLRGGDGDDHIGASLGADSLEGGNGNDTLIGGGGADRLTGGADADVFDYNHVSDSGAAVGVRDVITDFTQGVDLIDLEGLDALATVAGLQHFTFVGTGAHTGAGATLRYSKSGFSTFVYGDLDANGTGEFAIQLTGLFDLTASDFTDLSIASVQGTAAADTISGGTGAELVLGLAGNDTLFGLDGPDTLRGGAGWDTMSGGQGGDWFDFDTFAEIGSAQNARDVIADFAPGLDRIDLGDIDALTNAAGVQHFIWLGTAGHTGAGATLRYQQSGANTLVFGDVDANGTADFTLQLSGLHNLTAADFTDLSIALIQGTAGNDVISGAASGKLMLGLAGNDTMSGGVGADTLRGGAGADSMAGGGASDVFDFNAVAEIGNAANARDIIADFQSGADLIDLGDIDALTTLAGVQHFTWLGTAAHTGAGATLRYQQAGGNTLIYGDTNANGGADFTLQLNGLFNLTAANFTSASITTIQGTNAADTLTGGTGGKAMHGLDGNDTITGGAGADTIFGGAGADQMGGGLGADLFRWNSAAHAAGNPGTRDIVTDFEQGADRLDLSGIDASSLVAGNQAFVFLGAAAHTGAGATLRFQQAGGNTVVFGDINGDKAADFAIQLTGLHTLTAADFVL